MSKQAMKLALDALTGSGYYDTTQQRQAIAALREALAQQPVADRAFLERVLTAMEGVIDVADRKTDEFDALRACIIDLTLMLNSPRPAQRTWVKLTDAETEHFWEISRAAMPRYHTFKTLIEKALRERNT